MVLAQQLVDAGGENGQGGLAFVLLVVLVAGIWGALFFMDRIRKRAAEKDDASRVVTPQDRFARHARSPRGRLTLAARIGSARYVPQ